MSSENLGGSSENPTLSPKVCIISLLLVLFMVSHITFTHRTSHYVIAHTSTCISTNLQAIKRHEPCHLCDIFLPRFLMFPSLPVGGEGFTSYLKIHRALKIKGLAEMLLKRSLTLKNKKKKNTWTYSTLKGISVILASKSSI